MPPLCRFCDGTNRKKTVLLGSDPGSTAFLCVICYLVLDKTPLVLIAAKSLTELQNGHMELTTDGELFKVILIFPEIC